MWSVLIFFTWGGPWGPVTTENVGWIGMALMGTQIHVRKCGSWTRAECSILVRWNHLCLFVPCDKQTSCYRHAYQWNLHMLEIVRFIAVNIVFIFCATVLIVFIAVWNASLIAINGFLIASVNCWTAIFSCSWKEKYAFCLSVKLNYWSD